MKKKITLLSLKATLCLGLLYLVSNTAGAQTYCSPEFFNGCDLFNDYYVDTVIGSDGFFYALGNGSNCGSSNYTSYVDTVIAGVPTPTTVTTHGYTGCTVWVDYDNDGTFESTENQFYANGNQSTTSNTFNFNINIPGYVPSGSYRMRVLAGWNSDGFTSGQANGYGPCGDYQYGNFDDFTVYVVNNSNCYPPTGTAITGTQSYSASFSWSAPASTTPTSYIWEVVPADSGSAYAAVATGSTSATSTTDTATGLAANTSYDLYIRSGCSGTTDSSVWIGPYNFTTLLAPCAGTPPAATLITIAYPGGDSACVGSTVEIAATAADTVTGIVYQWQQSSSATGPWTNAAAGGNGDTSLIYYTAPLTGTIYYQLLTTCTFSNASTATGTYEVPVYYFSIPYLQTFETTPYATIPNCYTNSTNSGNFSQDSWSVENNYFSANGTPMTAIILDDPNDAGKDAAFTLPGLQMQAGVGYTINFRYARGRDNSNLNTGNDFAERLQLFVNSSNPGGDLPTIQDGTSLFHEQITFDSVADTNIYYTPATTGTYYFSYFSNTPAPNGEPGGTVAVDSISIKPTCTVPSITTQPLAQTVCAGNPVTLTVVSDTGVTYQWENDGVAVSGATNATYSIPAAVAADTGNYFVLVSSATCGVAVSNLALVTVNPLPDPVIAAAGATLSINGSFTTYQWNEGGQPITGANSATYTATTNGSYTVTVTDANGCSATSAPQTISGLSVTNVNNNNAVSIYPNPATTNVYIDAPVPVNVSISDMEGKVILQQYGVKNIDLSQFANGVYLIKVTDNNGEQLKLEKLVKTAN